MKTALLFSFVGFAAGSLIAAEPAQEIKAAAQKLADKPSYAWTAKSESPQSRGRGFSPASGKTEKGGVTCLVWQGRERSTEAFKKGDKVVVKVEDEWQTAAELEDADNNRARFTARRVQSFKPPAQEAAELAGRLKNLKKEGDAYSGELTPEALKQMYSFGRRSGGEGPDVSGLKGTAKFWIKDGLLSKYQTHIQGKMTFGQDNREVDIDRTTIYEITDVGSAKIEIPAEAKKKLG